MTFAGVNYLAIVVAGVSGWLVGAVWYMILGKPWMTANNLTPVMIKRRGHSALPFMLAFMAQVLMAWVLAGLMAHLGAGQVTPKNGVISGAFCWLGFVVTTLVVNYTFAGRKPALVWIDGGHWLAVLVVQGAIIGAFGLR